jgi:hypothetical protein
LDTNHFISFYIELFHFLRLRSIFRVPAALSPVIGAGMAGGSKKRNVHHSSHSSRASRELGRWGMNDILVNFL